MPNSCRSLNGSSTMVLLVTVLLRQLRIRDPIHLMNSYCDSDNTFVRTGHASGTRNWTESAEVSP